VKAFIISSSSEIARVANVTALCNQLPEAEIIDAIYPSSTRVPFLDRLIAVSKKRTGRALLPAEIGCLLSHRKIWQRITQMKSNETEAFLVLESDSIINDLKLLNSFFTNSSYLYKYDLFFFGAWLGHMKLLKSTRKKIDHNYSIGEPFIKTVYCTYGYSINAKAAAYLLKQTKQIAFPVDQFKYFVEPGRINIGGIVPELISGGNMGSYINQTSTKFWQRKLFMHLLDIKNNIICFFK
jgi:GR25 family glycosyltransferase involved in LPS biosynthesis